MNFTPIEAAERHRYIDRSIEATLSDLRVPEIQRQLGARALLFEEMLTSAVVSNMNDGVISLPDGYDHDTCPLPIATYTALDELELSGDFNSQTPMQTEATKKVFRKWQPKGVTAQEFYEFFTWKNRSEAHSRMSFPELTASQVGTAAWVIPAADQLKWFLNAPNKGMALIKQRPVMMLQHRSGKTNASPSTVGHELTHVHQALREPVITIHSPRSAEMHSLREELEAYCFGFAFASKELLEVGSENIEETSTLMQISVEWTRREHVLDPEDPFRPSGFMLRTLKEQGMEAILHGMIDYEGLTALVEAHATPEE